ncbi:MAG: hypothetical protein WCD18_27780 [Thermosynechococcaceae cyanobacterium]
MTKPSRSRSVSGQEKSLPKENPIELVSVDSAAVEPEPLESAVEPEPLESAVEPETPIDPESRQQPIPPPSEPLQFRAIGLVRGKYQPSEERFNRGMLEVDNGMQLDAVLLGQVMSLVKKYIALDRPYNWVVYPRTREKEQTLHLQIVGVWSADGFGPITGLETEADPTPVELAQPIEDGYFSVRGQIVFQSQEKQLLYVKIQQAARKSKDRGERAKAFKLKINGTLPQKAVGYFWDLQVQRDGNELVLKEGTSIAPMPVQKNQRPQKRPSKPFSKMPNSPKPNRAYKTQAGGVTPPSRESRPVPKPIKRQSNPSDS